MQPRRSPPRRRTRAQGSEVESTVEDATDGEAEPTADRDDEECDESSEVRDDAEGESDKQSYVSFRHGCPSGAVPSLPEASARLGGVSEGWVCQERLF